MTWSQGGSGLDHLMQEREVVGQIYQDLCFSFIDSNRGERDTQGERGEETWTRTQRFTQ